MSRPPTISVSLARLVLITAVGLSPRPAKTDPAVVLDKPTDDSALRPVGWGLLGGGVAAAGVGIGFGLASGDAEVDHKRAHTGAGKKATADRAQRDALVADMAFAGAGFLAVCGVTLLLLEGRPNELPAVAPTTNGAGWVFVF